MIQIIRHAESLGNAGSKWYQTYPDWAMPLSDKGIEQAKALKTRLEEHHKRLYSPYSYTVFVSPFVRTQQTMKYALHEFNKGKKSVFFNIIEDSRLREQDWGDGSRDMVEERTQKGTYFYKFPNGESVAQVDDRVRSFLLDYRHIFTRTDSHVLFFTHGMTNRVLLKNFLNKTPKDLETWHTQKNTGIWSVLNYVPNTNPGIHVNYDAKFLENYSDPIEYYPTPGHNFWDILETE